MIKASFEILQPANSQSFLVRKFDKLAFDAPYHFHEEYELTCVINGSGKRYVGNHMDDFAPGDLVLLGSNLPHCWKLNETATQLHEASALVIQFNDAFLGDEFFNKFELLLIKELFQKSSCGISFHSETQEEVKRMLLALVEEKNNFKMLIGLLEILHYMASSAQYILLDQYRIVAERPVTGRDRITPVFAYLTENFRKQVSLDKAAGIANMTTNAFQGHR